MAINHIPAEEITNHRRHVRCYFHERAGVKQLVVLGVLQLSVDLRDVSFLRHDDHRGSLIGWLDNNVRSFA